MALIIGNASTATTSSGLSMGYVIAQRFQATGTGNIVTFRYRASTTGNVMVGIYSDSAGSCGTLLNQSGSQAVISGENTLTIPSTAITSGTFYWLAYNQDTNILDAMDMTASGKSVSYLATPFGNSFPSPYGTPTGTATTWDLNIGASSGASSVVKDIIGSGFLAAPR